jgi:hypothetical protein
VLAVGGSEGQDNKTTVYSEREEPFAVTWDQVAAEINTAKLRKRRSHTAKPVQPSTCTIKIPDETACGRPPPR